MPPDPEQSQLAATRSWVAALPFYYGWVVVGVAFVTMGIGVSLRTAYSLIFPEILNEFHWSRAETAAVFSTGFFTGALLSPVLGVVMDRFGPRVVFPSGAVLVSVGLVLSTQVVEKWQLHLTMGAMVIGGTVIFSFVGHSMFLPHWFVRRRGLAVGIAFSGVGVGSMLLFPWVQTIIAAHGWRAASWVFAGLVGAVVLPLNLLLQRDRPEDLGLRPDGDETLGGEESAAHAQSTIVDPVWAATAWTLGKAARTARYWWLSLAFFTALIAWYEVQVHQTKYLLEIGIGASEAAMALGLVGLLGIGGQIGLGHLSDRIGREWSWSIAQAGFALCYALLLLLGRYPSPWVLYAMVASQGLLGYGMASIYGAIPAELFQGRKFATIFGTISLTGSLGAASGPWAAGALQDMSGSYDTAFALTIGVCAVSIFAIWQAAPRKVRLVGGQARRLAPRDTAAHGK